MVTVGRDGPTLDTLSLPRRDMVPRCCENGRPVVADPHTGQTICSCQYSSGLLGYPRVPTLGEAVYGASAAYAAAAQSYMPLGADGSAFYSPLTSPPYDGAKDAVEGWRHLAHTGGMYFPYDTSMAAYPYGPGFGPMDLNAARRKNATKEATNTLKAWLYEHRKNPYPTKGEKIMLAIITKMTLTQVSTWFANARRRLKKENKMTWSPRNRSDDDGDDFDDMGDDDKDDDDKDKLADSSEGVQSRGGTAPNSPTPSAGQDREALEVDDAEAHIDVDDVATSSTLSNRSSKDSLPHRDSDVPRDTDSPVLSNSKDNSVSPSLTPSITDIRSSGLSLAKMSSASKTTERAEVTDASPRPKIWSVSQFLPTNTDSQRSRESTVTSSLTSSTSHPYSMSSPSSHRGISSSGQGHAFLPSSRATGGYGRALSYVSHPLPMTLSSSGLDFPYSLSSVKPSLSAPSTTVSRQEALLAATASALRSQPTAPSIKSSDVIMPGPSDVIDKRDSPPLP